jgi:lysyl-tRNA synthetase class 2
MEELSELLLQRRRKVDTLWEAGINPYPNDFKPQHTSADIAAEYGAVEPLDAGSENLVVAGRILARRSFGKAAFIQLQDRKGRIQIYVKKDEIGDEAFAAFDTFDIGDIVGVEGYPFRTKTGELSLHARNIRLLV